MNLTKEQCDEVEQMAYHLIQPGLIAVNIGVNEQEFIEQIRTAGTQARTSFYRGYIRQLIEVRASLIKSAKNGSNPAQQELIKFIKQQQQFIDYE